jgi:hypothetical protein
LHYDRAQVDSSKNERRELRVATIWEKVLRWKVQRRTVYAGAGLAMLYHQTFIAHEAQPQLIAAAIILLGLPLAGFRDDKREKPKEDG